MLNEHQKRQLLGLALAALSLFCALSLIPLGAPPPDAFPQGNIMGVLGTYFRSGGFAAFGAGILLVPPMLAFGAAASFGWLAGSTAMRWIALATGLIVLVPSAAALLSAESSVQIWPVLPAVSDGWIGTVIGEALVALLTKVGAVLVLVLLFVALSVASIGWNPAGSAARHGLNAVGVVRRRIDERRAAVADPDDDMAGDDVAFGPAPEARDAKPDAEPAAEATPPRPGLRKRMQRRAGSAVQPEPDRPRDTGLPPLDLLSEPEGRGGSLSDPELDRLGEVLIRTLRTFKVEGEIAGRTTGPVVTQFEVVPAPGVKVNRIAALDADLALALRAPSIRIVAPIPGKGAVGVEVPNPEPEIVHLRRILEAPAYQRARGSLPLGLGKDLTGKPYVADLARMPHLLIAGATGSGKSVCVNTLITSLVYKHTPRTLRLLMIDPKMVELSMYAKLPHLRHPVVTNPNDAAAVLKWAVYEMERRYALLSANGARSIGEFNRRIEDGARLERPGRRPDDDPDDFRYEDGPLPFIVVVVDELADLMMTVQADIEKPLAQLAQKARAIGIHLIVATQRPSVNVITGLIKANFPCRIAFRVASKVDSRTIIDQNGADALLGNGDMLFLPPTTSDPVRVQGAFLSTDDTERMVKWFSKAGVEEPVPSGEDDILEFVREREASDTDDAQLEVLEERDVLFRQAAELCIQHNQGSTSLLQRRLRIGYGRAARVIDQLHHAGILGPPDGSKPREVLVGLESLDHVTD
jgi:S-DNA-T family DNA segregation ATPase FtsK/SpoIIIE